MSAPDQPAANDPKYVVIELRARIAELEAEANTAICIFCGTKMEKDLTVMLDHAKDCEKRPENELMRRIAELETEAVRLTEWAERSEALAVEEGVKRAELEAENEGLLEETP